MCLGKPFSKLGNTTMLGLSKTKVRILVILLAIIMFCIQFETAIKNLTNPPTVDSTYITELENIDLPLITVCPTNQTNITALEESGYFYPKFVLAGWKTDEQITSWGDKQNLTFRDVLKILKIWYIDDDELDSMIHFSEVNYHTYLLINQIFDLNSLDALVLSDNNFYNFPRKDIIFFPKYGFCYQVSNYSTKFEVGIISNIKQDIRVFVTDRNFKSYFSLDYASHQGSPIIVSKGVSQRFEVKIDVSSTCPVETEVTAKNDFEKCVDRKVQEKIGKPLGCIPPWISPNNQCNGSYPYDFVEKKIPDFEYEYIDLIYGLKKTEIEKKCRKYCSSTTVTVQEGEKFEQEQDQQEIQITFNDRVKVTETVFNYSPFQFIIDVGSSVGLWLGLSVLGLYDLWILILEYIQSREFFRKLNSATK